METGPSGRGSNGGRLVRTRVETESPERRWDARGSLVSSADRYAVLPSPILAGHALPVIYDSQVVGLAREPAVGLAMVVPEFRNLSVRAERIYTEPKDPAPFSLRRILSGRFRGIPGNNRTDDCEWER